MNVIRRTEVLVAMSGGVDSSVAAALLCKQGFKVTGVTMRVWDGPESPSQKRHGCYGPGEEADVEDARRVARILGIEHRTLDVIQEYRREVIEYFKAEYAMGRTPNPCTRCNPRIKFGVLAAKASESGINFDYFATGHYARTEYDRALGRYLLKKARDLSKDQSYFLAFLSQAQLARALFPVGEYSKAEVRGMAASLGLGVSQKADSQDFAREPESLVSSEPGPIFDVEGRRLGMHRGISHYTVGQRKDLGISAAEPLYVTRIDASQNAIIVGVRSQALGRGFVASSLNWVCCEALREPAFLKVKIRYRHEEAAATVEPLDSGRVKVEFVEPQWAITPGQTAVFYRDDVVVGAGVIDLVRG